MNCSQKKKKIKNKNKKKREMEEWSDDNTLDLDLLVKSANEQRKQRCVACTGILLGLANLAVSTITLFYIVVSK